MTRAREPRVAVLGALSKGPTRLPAGQGRDPGKVRSEGRQTQRRRRGRPYPARGSPLGTAVEWRVTALGHRNF